MDTISPIINGIKYLIKNKNDSIGNYLLGGKQWNNEIFNIIKHYFFDRKLGHFLNVGSHIGSLCLPLSLHIDKVTAIEAYPPTYNHLCENITLNNISNVITHNVAVGNSEDIVYFMSEDKICPIENINRVSNNSGGMHVFTENDIDQNIRSAILTDKKIQATMNKFDNLEIDNFDIMLVDIEGCEYDFLLGAKEKLLKNRPIIIIEIWDNNKRVLENMKTTREDVIELILSLNFKLITNVGEDFIFEPLLHP